MLDEEQALPGVLASLPRPPLRRVVVVDNGSRDRSAELARAAGAEVLQEPRRGYGRACLRGLAHLEANPPELVVFLDGDGSDDPADLERLLAPLREGRADLVIGSRTLGRRQAGALNLPQRIGNWAAGWLLGLLFGRRFTDLGPFRIARYAALRDLGMRDPTWGWTVEMQARAIRAGWRILEVPVRYRRRQGGRSKISGDLVGALRAAGKIFWTLGWLFCSARQHRSPSPRPGGRGSSAA
ncbi:MAG: glycosyltransferase family 2 protein [Acidobacteriota bacterium]